MSLKMRLYARDESGNGSMNGIRTGYDTEADLRGLPRTAGLTLKACLSLTNQETD